MKTSIQIPTTVNAAITNLGFITVNYGTKTSELAEGRFTCLYVFLDEVIRGFQPEDIGTKRLEVAILQCDAFVSKKALDGAVASIDEANPWRFGGISALLTVGHDEARTESFNLIAFGSPNGPGAREGYPVLTPGRHHLNICPRCRDEAILIVRDAPAS